MENNQHEPSSEEYYIQDYFNRNGISFIPEYKTGKLKGDSKSYRKVDFYLKKYDVYVEYFGLYNSTKEIRSGYDEKVDVYLQNDMPSIFIYPHELGFLDYAFHTKMLKILRLDKFKNNFKLFKYKLKRYSKKGKGHLFFTSLFWFYLFIVFSEHLSGFNEGMDSLMIIISFIVSLFYFIRFGINLVNYFYYEY